MPDIVDPWSGLKASTNALFEVARSGQRDRALGQQDTALRQQDDRNQILREKHNEEKLLIPLKYQQAKMEVGMQFLPGLRRDNYGHFHQWATNPIDKKTGYGAIPAELLPDPNQISQMDDTQFEDLKKRMFMSAKQLSEMNVADYKSKLEESITKLKGQQSINEINARGNIYSANDQRTMAQIEAQRKLEELRASNSLALENTRQANTLEEIKGRKELVQAGGGRGGSRDPMRMDIVNRAQALIDARRKAMADPMSKAPDGQKAMMQIDQELQGLAERYRQMGYDPQDFLVNSQGAQNAGGPMPGERVYVPGKGFVSSGQQAPVTAGAP